MPSADAALWSVIACQSPAKRRIRRRILGGARVGGQAREAVFGDHFSSFRLGRQVIDIVTINFRFSMHQITDHFPFLSIGGCFGLV